MNESIVENFLAHHGVKGMRWGVRNKVGKYSYETPFEKQQRKERNAKRVRNAVLIAIGTAYLSAYFASANAHIRRGNAINKIDKGMSKLNDSGKYLGPKLNVNWKPDSSLKRSQWYNYKPPKNARAILMAQERQRNGAYQVQQMLKKMGNNTL